MSSGASAATRRRTLSLESGASGLATTCQAAPQTGVGAAPADRGGVTAATAAPPAAPSASTLSPSAIRARRRCIDPSYRLASGRAGGRALTNGNGYLEHLRRRATGRGG